MRGAFYFLIILFFFVLMGLIQEEVTTEEVPSYIRFIAQEMKKRDLQAKQVLKLIQQEEEVYRKENGCYVSCDYTSDCNNKLGLAIPLSDWNYRVIVLEKGDGFCAEAIGTLGSYSWWIREIGESQKGRCLTFSPSP